MSTINYKISTDLESNLSSYTTTGQIIFTDKTINLVKSDGTQVQYAKEQIEIVDSLPTVNIDVNKIFLLKGNKTINVYDGTSWTHYGGQDIPSNYVQIGGDIDGTGSSPIVSKLNGTSLDNTNKSNGRAIVYNSTTGNDEYADITVAGIVGSTGIIQPSWFKMTFASGEEKTFNHPSATDDKIMINIVESIAGETKNDTHVDFSDNSKYYQQNSNETTISNSIKLKAGASCLSNYKLNETSGSICTDSKGNYNGTYHGTTTVTDGNGTYRTFNGTSDYISFSNQVILPGKKTIKFKIKSSMSISVQGVVMTNRVAGNGFSIWFQNGTLIFSCQNGTTGINLYTHSQLLNDNVWHTIIFTWNGTTNTNGIHVIVDNTSYYGTASIVDNTGSISLYIGQRGDSNYYFQGSLDEIEIYNDVVDFSDSNTNPYYVTTTGQSNFSLPTIATINSLTIPVTIPTNASVKWLI